MKTYKQNPTPSDVRIISKAQRIRLRLAPSPRKIKIRAKARWIARSLILGIKA